MLLTSLLVLLCVHCTSAFYRGGPLYGSNFGVPGRNATFDYVVVGGGTAGLAIAARLAENTSNTVAVIEAGGFYEIDAGNTSQVPNLGLVYDTGILMFTDAFPQVDWGIVTTNQTGLMDQEYHYWRGKTLGGSSALNNEVYHRASIGSYQMWADMVDDTSYTFDNLLPYFQKGTHYTPPDMTKRAQNASVPSPAANAFEQSGGPLEVGYINAPLPFGSWAKLSFLEMGFKEVSDFDHGVLINATQYTTQTIAPDMTRSSSQASYLEWALASGRQNLIVYPRTLAKGIMFDSNLTATGVEVNSYGLPYNITARREVILAGGAINSPQLLMVSGIGPSTTLNSLSIPVLVDLPGVGQNLQDHVLFTVTHQVNVQSGGRLNNPTNLATEVSLYRTNRTGFLSNTGFDFVAWEKLPASYRANLSTSAQADLSKFPSDWPELEFIIGDANNPLDDNNYASCIGAIVAPLSRGNVTINSTDTSENAIFNPCWLCHPTDQEVAVQSLKRCRDMFAATAVQPVLIGPEFAPGPKVQTNEEILAFIQATAGTVYHAASTCKMGNNTDEMSVVDSKTRVKGVNGLRVVDASVIPMLLPGHPTGTFIYALAEKIADDIMTGR